MYVQILNIFLVMIIMEILYGMLILYQVGGKGETLVQKTAMFPINRLRLKKEIVQQFGQEMYDLAEAAGALFYYDDTTPVPARFLKGDIGEYNKRVNGTTGRYSIYYKDSTYTGQHCQNGEKSLFFIEIMISLSQQLLMWSG
ncbi:hypothetical protein OL548_19955 [Lysinibacillus sp. MHQ-1]|nr:hypothetical protein OL548_19955 [Lysinibacillus sp. MHQ-1]